MITLREQIENTGRAKRFYRSPEDAVELFFWGLIPCAIITIFCLPLTLNFWIPAAITIGANALFNAVAYKWKLSKAKRHLEPEDVYIMRQRLDKMGYPQREDDHKYINHHEVNAMIAEPEMSWSFLSGYRIVSDLQKEHSDFIELSRDRRFIQLVEMAEWVKREYVGLVSVGNDLMRAQELAKRGSSVARLSGLESDFERRKNHILKGLFDMEELRDAISFKASRRHDLEPAPYVGGSKMRLEQDRLAKAYQTIDERQKVKG